MIETFLVIVTKGDRAAQVDVDDSFRMTALSWTKGTDNAGGRHLMKDPETSLH